MRARIVLKRPAELPDRRKRAEAIRERMALVGAIGFGSLIAFATAATFFGFPGFVSGVCIGFTMGLVAWSAALDFDLKKDGGS